VRPRAGVSMECAGGLGEVTRGRRLLGRCVSCQQRKQWARGSAALSAHSTGRLAGGEMVRAGAVVSRRVSGRAQKCPGAKEEDRKRVARIGASAVRAGERPAGIRNRGRKRRIKTAGGSPADGASAAACDGGMAALDMRRPGLVQSKAGIAR
jgi:hypothetical protein